MIPNKPGHICKGTVKRETDMAVLFLFTSIDNEEIEPPKSSWVPLSQVDKRLTNPNTEGEDEMVCSTWILNKIGFDV